MISSDHTNVPKWYILTYIGSHRDAGKRLAMIDLPSFAPVFFDKSYKNKSQQDFRHFANYAFVFGSQNQIYQHKRRVLRSFNFLPKNFGKDMMHPYVEEYVVEQLRKIEKLNDGMIPYTPYPSDVIAGDTIRILAGQFKDMHATAIIRNGSKYRDIIIDVAGTIVIPLCKLKADEYEIEKYNDGDRHPGGIKARKEDVTFLREALGRHYAINPSDKLLFSKDQAQIHRLIKHYTNGTPETHLQRVKTTLILVMAYTILGKEEEQLHYIKHTYNLIKVRCTLALKANVYCTLYACTFSDVYYNLYQAVRKEAQGLKDTGFITKNDKDMALYRKWNSVINPRRSRCTLRCDTKDEAWFALELVTVSDKAMLHFQENGIETFSLDVKSENGRSVLLAYSTFDTLRRMQVATNLFAFMRDNRDNHDVVLYIDEQHVSDYRYMIASEIPGVHQLELTPKIDDILSRAKTTDIIVDGHLLHGIVSTTTVNNTRQHRFIVCLRHLTAVEAPYPFTHTGTLS